MLAVITPRSLILSLILYPFHCATPRHTSLVFEVSRPFGAHLTQGGFQVEINDSFKGTLILYNKGSLETKQAFSAERNKVKAIVVS